MGDEKVLFGSKKRFGRRKSSNGSRISKKSRRTSSDNVSTPASNRSRSPSIMSTGDEDEQVLIEEDQIQLEAGRSDIDQILELVQELKQKDLDEYKRQIHLKNRETTGVNSGEWISIDKNIEELSDENIGIFNDSIKSEEHNPTVNNKILREDLKTALKKEAQERGLSENNIQSKNKQKKHGNKIAPDENLQAESKSATPTAKLINLDAVLVPTRKMKILPAEKVLHNNSNTMSLVIKSFPMRMVDPSTVFPPAPSRDQLPQVIKRNSIVPPHSGLNSFWPSSLISSPSLASPLRTSLAVQDFSQLTAIAGSVQPSITVQQTGSQDSITAIAGSPNPMSDSHTGSPHSTSDIAVKQPVLPHPVSAITRIDAGSSHSTGAIAVDQAGTSGLTTVIHTQQANKVTSKDAAIISSDDIEQGLKDVEAGVTMKIKIQEDGKTFAVASDIIKTEDITERSNLTMRNVEKSVVKGEDIERSLPNICIETDEKHPLDTPIKNEAEENKKREIDSDLTNITTKFYSKFRDKNLEIPSEVVQSTRPEEVKVQCPTPSPGSQTPKISLGVATQPKTPQTPKLSLDINITSSISANMMADISNKAVGLSKKSSFHLPPLDPAVEIICRDWRSNSPSTPSTPGKDSKLSSVWEARSRRIQQTCQARQQFLCNGPGGMALRNRAVEDKDKSVEDDNEMIGNKNDKSEEPGDVDGGCTVVHGTLKLGIASNNKVHRASSQVDQTEEQRNFTVEKSFSSDLVSGLSDCLTERKVSKSSLFTRLRRRQLGSRGRVGDGATDVPDHRLSLALSETVPTTGQSGHTESGNVSRQGSQSCPSSPNLNSRRLSKGWKNVFKGKTSR
eukprot:GFUD01002888.1.p1 GENE.GFUD01002888.1~~GFUD01002888.1.p1  ORF type:complete len:941 (+),score=266.90 GFUD01002888.1:286-2823(+)